jgi:flavin-dependent dehydrogenase
MEVDSSSDLLVIGGGPAGLATAIEARMAGLQVLLIDKRKPPLDAACGEGVMPIGVHHLDRLGVEVSARQRAVFRGIRYFDGEYTAEARFRESHGLGIRRTVLHAALHRRAIEVGVEFRWGEKAHRLGSNGVECDSGTFHARWLVAADGRLSMVRDWAGLEVRAPLRRRYAVRRHYACAPWSEFVEVHWADHAEAYVTPVGPDAVGVAMLSCEAPINFDRLMGRFPVLRRRLEGASPASRDRGAGPFGQRPAAVASGQIALVGDASGCLDPITGEGLSLAFAQAHAVIRCLEQGCVEGYSGAHRSIVRAPRILTGGLLIVQRHPRLRRFAMRACATLPSLFANLVNIAASAHTAPDAPRPRTPRSTGRSERSGS